MKLIEINNLSKTYQTLENEIHALENINLDIYEKEILAFLGPSGCGKSSLFNILTNNEDYKGKLKTNKKLVIGYMMQEDAVLPFLTVFENATLGLKLKKMMIDENIDYVKDLLKKYGLYEFINEYPKNLSGGLKQRLALVRTLAIKPNILLLDEPFSKLDMRSRLNITDDVFKIIRELNITTILISHDIAEALSVSDRIVIFTSRPGKIKKIITIDNKDLPSIRRKNESFNKKYKEIEALYDK